MPRWGYYALVVPAAMRAASYLGVVPWHPGEVVAGVTWLAITWLVVTLAEGTARHAPPPPPRADAPRPEDV